MSELTPFQTVGPYLHLGLRAGLGPMTSAEGTAPVVISGRLIDGAGDGIGDGAIEFWAAGFDDVGRVWTAADGSFRLDAVMPPTRVDPDGAVHAPHFAVRVLGRGILTEYLSRVYFGGHPDNDRDVVLRAVPADRRTTLVAVPGTLPEYRFEIVVQGEHETVFFDV
jgi:protocatechuate 3,4-dioxygenase alpha subunit